MPPIETITAFLRAVSDQRSAHTERAILGGLLELLEDSAPAWLRELVRLELARLP